MAAKQMLQDLNAFLADPGTEATGGRPKGKACKRPAAAAAKAPAMKRPAARPAAVVPDHGKQGADTADDEVENTRCRNKMYHFMKARADGELPKDLEKVWDGAVTKGTRKLQTKIFNCTMKKKRQERDGS